VSDRACSAADVARPVRRARAGDAAACAALVDAAPGALRHGHVCLEPLVPAFPPAAATRHECARAVVTALQVLGARLTRAT
jgi:hypothetical protein